MMAMGGRARGPAWAGRGACSGREAGATADCMARVLLRCWYDGTVAVEAYSGGGASSAWAAGACGAAEVTLALAVRNSVMAPMVG